MVTQLYPITMPLKPLLTLLLICSFACQTFAQQAPTLLKGLVTDKETTTPLAYVSVGILNKPLGTVSDTAGRFTFSIGPDNLADTLQLSIVGYTALKMAVKDFMARGDKPVQLTPKTQQLAEVRVTIATPKTNIEVIGRTAVSKVVQVSVHNKKSADETIGSEMGMLYKTSRKNAVIKDFNFYVSVNNFNTIKFRVNIYAVKNALPDTLLYNKQIFATLQVRGNGKVFA